ncbi:hypothetical protein NDU88_001179 [Pleurodeles waltl]|uniref:Uncharacterized protein n=1 Tax=Pleurodeles waltl TaxID=8319 RepID=A0AAV7SYR0_PLEWA|nr:hypothetical protein NDU88_001179 [Pleurodeles waltl]
MGPLGGCCGSQRMEGRCWAVAGQGEPTVLRPTMVWAGYQDPVGQGCCRHCGPLLGVCVFGFVQCGGVLEIRVYFELGGVYRQWNTAVGRPPCGFAGRNGMGVFLLALRICFRMFIADLWCGGIVWVSDFRRIP